MSVAGQLDLFTPRWMNSRAEICGRCLGSGHIIIPGRFADLEEKCRECAGTGRKQSDHGGRR